MKAAKRSALAALPMFAGQLIGHFTRRHIAEAPFRLMVLILMVVSGANLIRKASMLITEEKSPVTRLDQSQFDGADFL